MKIIGNTVGTSLPKPNLMQTDPKKGDYVKGKSEFLERVNNGVTEEKIQEAVGSYIDKNPITIQPATEERLGGIKLGENLTITDEGVLSSETDEDDFVEITNLEVEQIIKNIGGF